MIRTRLLAWCLLAALTGATLVGCAAPTRSDPAPSRAAASAAPDAVAHRAGAVPATGRESAGVLLRTTPMPAYYGVPQAGRQVRIRYTSISPSTNHTVVTSGAVYYPAGSPPAGGWPVIGFGHGTTGVADACAPSRAPLSTQHQFDYVSALVDSGHVVVATDYQGLGTPGPHLYMDDAQAEARSILDAVRAVQHADHQLSSQVVLAGQSQGAQAAFAAAGYAKSYAPHLDVAGVVATGTPYLPLGSALLGTDTGTELRGRLSVVLYALHGLRELHPHFDLGRVLTPRAIPLMEHVDECGHALIDRIDRMDRLTARSAIQPGGVRVLLRAMKRSGDQYPTLGLPFPAFMATGTLDRTINVRLQHRLAEKVCAAGTRLDYAVAPRTGHSRTPLAVSGRILAFIDQIVRGDRPQSNCGRLPDPLHGDRQTL